MARMYDTFSWLINVITIAKLYSGFLLLNMTYTFKFYSEILCCTKDFLGRIEVNIQEYEYIVNLL